MIKRGKKRRPTPVQTDAPSAQCEEFSVLLAEYWEGDATASLRTEIERHAQTCPACAQLFESYRLTIRACRIAREAPTGPPSHKELWNELFQQIKALQDYLEK
jgi:anti-sigma factor RsiW